MSENSLPSPDNLKPAVAPAPSLEELKQQAAEYLNGWQRARADYANLKRESESKLEELKVHATAELLHDLLPLVEYFRHALRAVPSTETTSAWVEGIRHIQTKLLEVLAYHGVREIAAVGEKFTPELHEAVGEIEDTGYPSGTVAEEVRPGFTLHGRLLQPARVKVVR